MECQQDIPPPIDKALVDGVESAGESSSLHKTGTPLGTHNQGGISIGSSSSSLERVSIKEGEDETSESSSNRSTHGTAPGHSSGRRECIC